MRYTVYGQMGNGYYRILAQRLTIGQAFSMASEHQELGCAAVIVPDGQRPKIVEEADPSWRETK